MPGTEHCSWWLWQIGEDPRLRGARKSHFGEGEFPGSDFPSDLGLGYSSQDALHEA